MRIKNTRIALISAFLITLPVSSALPGQVDSTDKFTLRKDINSKKLRMLHGKSSPITIRKRTNETTADSVKNQFAPYFGIKDPAAQLSVRRDTFPDVNHQSIRYQQRHHGIPVVAGELVANLHDQQLTAMSGEVSEITLTDVTPLVTAEQASEIAKVAVAKWYGLNIHTLVATAPELSIYDPSLVTGSDAPQALTWKLSVSPSYLSDINEFLLVDAKSGIIKLHFSQIDTALSRETYTANFAEILPGTLVCNESDPTCSAGDNDARNAHRYAEDTYNFYFDHYGRNSLDGNGMTIRSTVNFGTLGNAFWAGAPYNQIAYGPGFSVADDVVAHELTHGVTENTSNLFYYYQSGAINESLSDVWGEFVDLTNNSGTDTPSVRWLVGEDVPGISAIRNMQNPTMLSDPDRMTSPFYYSGIADNAGVHINSGINNKAVYLMVDGDSFNSHVITGIGITKVAQIYYEVQTNYLTSGSDYLDLYYALNQACQSLIGVSGITASDCNEVKNATEAVEMNISPLNNYRPKAEICAEGSQHIDLFMDDFETDFSAWSTASLIGTASWSRVRGWADGVDYAASGVYSAVVRGTPTTHDSVLTLNDPISIPATGTYYLYFSHAFDFEMAGTNNYDGGVIEYSIDGGSNWIDASSFIDSGRNYNGTLYADDTNPLAGEDAFTADSHGYNSTRLDLTGLAGEDILFRFRSTADSTVSSQYWSIDDVRIYSCVANVAPTSNAGTDQDVNANTAVTLNGALSSDPEGDSLIYQWTQTGGASVSLTGATTTTPSFTTPSVMATLTFQLRVTDSLGTPGFSAVNVIVNGPPSANAGTNQLVNVDQNVILTGSGIDPEGGSLTYSWVQSAGTSTVTLANAMTASPSFTAPANADSLAFQLTVTDDHGQTGTDTVELNVQAPQSLNGGCSFQSDAKFDPIWLLILSLLSLVHIRRRT